MVVEIWKGIPGPRLFQGNPRWWNIIPFGQIIYIYIFTCRTLTLWCEFSWQDNFVAILKRYALIIWLPSLKLAVCTGKWMFGIRSPFLLRQSLPIFRDKLAVSFGKHMCSDHYHPCCIWIMHEDLKRSHHMVSCGGFLPTTTKYIFICVYIYMYTRHIYIILRMIYVHKSYVHIWCAYTSTTVYVSDIPNKGCLHV